MEIEIKLKVIATKTVNREEIKVEGKWKLECCFLQRGVTWKMDEIPSFVAPLLTVYFNR